MRDIKILPNGMVQLPDGSVVPKEAFDRILQGYQPIGGTPVGTEPPVGPPIQTTSTPVASGRPVPSTMMRTPMDNMDMNRLRGREMPAPMRTPMDNMDMNRLRGREIPKPPLAEESGQQPSGLLDVLLSQKTGDAKPKRTGKDWAEVIGAGLLSMSNNPGLQKLGMYGFERMGTRRDEERALAKTNRTVDALIGAGVVKPEQADALRNNPDLIKTVYAAALKGDGETIARYKWLLENPEQAAKLKDLGAIGGGGTTINMPGNTDVDELRKKLSGAEGDILGSYLKVGGASAAAQADIELLAQAAMASPTGPVTGRLLELFPEANDNAAVFNALVQRIAPTLRVEGSGSTSDIEFEGMLKSLGSLRNSPEANQMIFDAFRAKAQLNVERASVVREYQNGDLDERQMREKLYQIDSRSILPSELKGVIERASAASVPQQYQTYFDQLSPERQKLFRTLDPDTQQQLYDAWFKGKVN